MSSNNGSFQPPPNSTRPDFSTLTPLHMAATVSGDAVRSTLSMMRAQPGMTDNKLAKLVNKRATDTTFTGGYTPLHYACQHGHPDAVQLLLDAGADPNRTKNNKATPLLCAISSAGHDTFPNVGMVQYVECINKLLSSPKFEIEANDRSGDERCSPVWLCVGYDFTGRDCLLQVLEVLLRHGFSPNGSIHDMSALHMALRNGHSECAVTLVRAGADLQTKARNQMIITEAADGTEETWTALEACRAIYNDDDFTRRLIEAMVAANAVAGPKSRVGALRAASKGDMEGVKKLAEKAITAADSLLKAGRWSEARGAYQEALAYPTDALDREGRFRAFTNLSACYLQTGKGKEGVDTARQFCVEFPDNPGALIALGQALVHPSNAPSTTAARNDEAIEVSGKAERLVLRNPLGRPDWKFGPGPKDLLDRAARIRRFALSQKRPMTRGVQFAQQALDEYNGPDGNTIKAARAIDEALKPENEHPNPTPMRALRGSIYYAWGKLLLESCSVDGDSEVKDAESLGLDDSGTPLEQAQAKIQFALSEFEYTADRDDINCQRFELLWNAALAQVVLGRYEGGSLRCLDALRQRIQLQERNLADTSRIQEPQDGIQNSGNADRIFMLETAFDLSKHLISLQAMESLKVDSAEQDELETGVGGNDAASVLEQAVSLELLRQPSMDKLMRQIASGELSDAKVSSTWAMAVKKAKLANASFAEFRSSAAAAVMQFAVSVHSKSSDASTRVIGTFINEAREWDAKVETPKELSKVERRVEPKRCGFCSTGNPPKTCPCGQAFYCRKECQVKAWKEHKKTCAARNKRSG